MMTKRGGKVGAEEVAAPENASQRAAKFSDQAVERKVPRDRLDSVNELGGVSEKGAPTTDASCEA